MPGTLMAASSVQVMAVVVFPAPEIDHGDDAEQQEQEENDLQQTTFSDQRREQKQGRIKMMR